MVVETSSLMFIGVAFVLTGPDSVRLETCNGRQGKRESINGESFDSVSWRCQESLLGDVECLRNVTHTKASR